MVKKQIKPGWALYARSFYECRVLRQARMVGIMDFEQRFPNALDRAMEQAHALELSDVIALQNAPG